VLSVVPETRVVSIAVVNGDSNALANRFNNSQLETARWGYMPARIFSKKSIPWLAIATMDNYIGDVASWSTDTERR